MFCPRLASRRPRVPHRDTKQGGPSFWSLCTARKPLKVPSVSMGKLLILEASDTQVISCLLRKKTPTCIHSYKGNQVDFSFFKQMFQNKYPKAWSTEHGPA